MVLCQYLVLSYPIAVVAVVYAFARGRGRRWAWAAYGLLLLPPLLLLLIAGGKEGMAYCILIILGFVALLGYYDLRRIKRRSTDGSASGTDGT